MTTVQDIPIVDVDSHVAEPEELWTSRMPARLGDAIPRVVWDEGAGESRWKVGDVLLSAVGEYCAAGWTEHFPSHPPTLQDADPACFDANRGSSGSTTTAFGPRCCTRTSSPSTRTPS